MPLSAFNEGIEIETLFDLCFGVEANDGNNTGNGKFVHLAASSRT